MRINNTLTLFTAVKARVRLKTKPFSVYSDSNNQRLLLGDSAMIPVPGKGLLKPQGTVSSAKQLRIDQKK